MKRARKAEEKEDKVHDTIKELKKKHVSPMQLRIWSEMVVSELHSSLDKPPNTSMFVKLLKRTTQPKH